MIFFKRLAHPKIFKEFKEARYPVPFYTKQGRLVNNVEISREMTHYPLARFTLHQDINHHLIFTGWSDEDIAAPISSALKRIFGNDITLELTVHPLNSGKKYKVDSYSSAFELKGWRNYVKGPNLPLIFLSNIYLINQRKFSIKIRLFNTQYGNRIRRSQYPGPDVKASARGPEKLW